MYSSVCLAGSSTKAGDCYSCQYFDCEHNLITAILKCVYHGVYKPLCVLNICVLYEIVGIHANPLYPGSAGS